jgi:hypothetical protein
MDKQRICKTCWFYEKDGTNWPVSKAVEVKPKPGQEWCTLNNAACPASRTCPSWMTLAGNRPVLDEIEGSRTKQEKAEARKEKRRLRKLAKKEKAALGPEVTLPIAPEILEAINPTK